MASDAGATEAQALSLCGALLEAYSAWVLAHVDETASPLPLTIGLGLFASEALGCLLTEADLPDGLDGFLDAWTEVLWAQVPERCEAHRLRHGRQAWGRQTGDEIH